MSEGEDLLLPEGACLLHIGPYKTGSTAVQATLHRSREMLGRHGVRYVGDGPRAMRAGWALIGSAPRGRKPVSEDEWRRLVDEVHTGPEPRVVVSTEDFGRIGPVRVRRLVDDLGADRLHVLAVVRRLDKLLPSQWQQRAQSFHTPTYEEYLRSVLGDDPEDPDRRAFWASHDVAAQVRRWVDVLPPGRFTLLVADETDRSLLPRTLERMLGLPSGSLEPDGRSNPSLSLNGIELLRQVNLAFAERRWQDSDYRRFIQRGMVPVLKSAPRSEHDAPIPRLPLWAVDRVVELSRTRAEAVAAAADRVRVLGDPDALRTVDLDDAPAEVVPPETLGIEAAVNAITGVLEAAVAEHEAARDRHERALAKAGRRSRRPRPRPVGATPTRELVGELGRRVRARAGSGRTS